MAPNVEFVNFKSSEKYPQSTFFTNTYSVSIIFGIFKTHVGRQLLLNDFLTSDMGDFWQNYMKRLWINSKIIFTQWRPMGRSENRKFSKILRIYAKKT